MIDKNLHIVFLIMYMYAYVCVHIWNGHVNTWVDNPHYHTHTAIAVEFDQAKFVPLLKTKGKMMFPAHIPQTQTTTFAHTTILLWKTEEIWLKTMQHFNFKPSLYKDLWKKKSAIFVTWSISYLRRLKEGGERECTTEVVYEELFNFRICLCF